MEVSPNRCRSSLESSQDVFVRLTSGSTVNQFVYILVFVRKVLGIVDKWWMMGDKKLLRLEFMIYMEICLLQSSTPCMKLIKS